MRSIGVIKNVAPRGISLIDALLAMTVLTVVMLSITYATTAGHQHLQHGDQTLRAVRLAEHLMEEILSRPYDGSGGATRSEWHIDDYHGFTEEPGELADFTGESYVGDDQRFSRSVTIEPASYTVASLDDITIPGKRVTVTVRDTRGREQSLERFMPEPTP